MLLQVELDNWTFSSKRVTHNPLSDVRRAFVSLSRRA